MILYLQANSNGTFSLSEKNNYKDDLFDCDYFELETFENITIKELNEKVKKYNCKKLILDL